MKNNIISDLKEVDVVLEIENCKHRYRKTVQKAIKLIKSYKSRTICHCENPEFVEMESGLRCCKNCGRC